MPLCPPQRSACRPPSRLVLAVLAVALLSLAGCDLVDKARMKFVGITVSNPEPETAEWVLGEVLQAGMEPDEEKGWERFQNVLHSDERSLAALQGWRQFGWPRIRKQAHLYVNDAGQFVLRDFREQQNDGIDFFLQGEGRELPTPCSVYRDKANNTLWRVKRCSL